MGLTVYTLLHALLDDAFAFVFSYLEFEYNIWSLNYIFQLLTYICIIGGRFHSIIGISQPNAHTHISRSGQTICLEVNPTYVINVFNVFNEGYTFQVLID